MILINYLKILTVVLSCVSAFGIQDSYSVDIHSETICELENECFVAGEQLVYKIYYNWKFIWVPAGEVHFEIIESDSLYIVNVEGSSYPSYDSFFKVRDRYQSIIDKETMLPNTFVRDVSQGDYVRYDSMIINQNKYSITEYYGKSKDNARVHSFELGNCTQDLLSILYHLRNRDISELKEGSKLPVSFFFSKKYYELDVNIINRKNKKIKGLGKFDVIHARPELITGSIFDENSFMDIYVSDDKNKIPLLVESPLRVGSAKAVLKSHKNLKFSFPGTQ